MFRENNSHLQPELFNSMTDMNPKIQEETSEQLGTSLLRARILQDR